MLSKLTGTASHIIWARNMSPFTALLLLGFFLNPTVVTIIAVLLAQDGVGVAGYLFVALRWAAAAHVIVFLGVAGYLIRSRKTLDKVSLLATIWCVGAILFNSWVVWDVGHTLGPTGGPPYFLVLLVELQFAVVVFVGLIVGRILGRVIFRQRNRLSAKFGR